MAKLNIKVQKLIGILSNKVQVEDLQPGDHIYTWRGLMCAHHGIYMGGGEVINHGARSQAEESNMVDKMISKAFKASVWSAIKCKECNGRVKSKSCVSKTCLRCFLEGGHVYRYEYGVSPMVHQAKRPGTCTPQEASEVEMVLHRANYLLAREVGFGEYHLSMRNSEDFALYCRLGIVGVGKGLSGQVASFKSVAIGKNIKVEDLVVELEAEIEITQASSTFQQPMI